MLHVLITTFADTILSFGTLKGKKRDVDSEWKCCDSPSARLTLAS